MRRRLRLAQAGVLAGAADRLARNNVPSSHIYIFPPTCRRALPILRLAHQRGCSDRPATSSKTRVNLGS
jgi:hypothetical protein